MKKTLLLCIFLVSTSYGAAQNLNDIILVVGSKRVATLDSSKREPLTGKTFLQLLTETFTPTSGFRHQPMSYQLFRVTTANNNTLFFDKNAYLQTTHGSRDFALQPVPNTRNIPKSIESFTIQPKITGFTDDEPFIARRGQVFPQTTLMARRRTPEEIQASGLMGGRRRRN